MPSTRRPTLSAALLAAVLLLTACGGDDAEEPADAATDTTVDEDAVDDTEVESEDAADTEDAPEGDAGADTDVEVADGPTGTVTAGGTTYTVDEVRRCEPLQDDVVERELELQARGDSDEGVVQIDVYVESIGGTPNDSVSWSGPEGVFGGPEDAVIEQTDGRVTGSATLLDSMTMEEQLEVEFDLPLPDDEIACR